MTEKKVPRCPKCRCYPSHVEEYTQVSGHYDVSRDGSLCETMYVGDNHITGIAYAFCGCGHEWRLKGHFDPHNFARYEEHQQEGPWSRADIVSAFGAAGGSDER